MLFATPTLHEAQKKILDQVEETRDRLKHVLRTKRRWLGSLRRNTFARAVQGSNSIEGYTVSDEDAIAVIEGEEPLDAEKETAAAVRGYRDAMTYVLELAQDRYFSYSSGLLNSLHFMMVSYDLSRNPGRWRLRPIYVRDEEREVTVYEAPDPDLVPELMAELMEGLNEEGAHHCMVKAAMAHLNLVMIHPYSDGNGRMARCLQTLVLAREGILESQFCSIEEFLGRNTRSYYEVLGRVGNGIWSPERDASEWVDYCLRAHHHQATTLIRRTREIDRIWTELEQLMKTRQLPERTIYALSDATFGWRVRNATYRKIAEVSDQVASRDLKLLTDQKLLVPAGEKRGRGYVAAEILRQIRIRCREPRPVFEPWTGV